MEKRIKFNNFVGPSNTLSADKFDQQRTINMYVELNPAGPGKEGEVGVLISTPGLRKLTTLPGGPIRCVYTPTANSTTMYAVAGSFLYKTTNKWSTYTLIGALNSNSGVVKMADNGSAATSPAVVIVDGVNVYTMLIGTESTTFTISPSANAYPADSVTYQDGYFILNRKDTGYFFVSDLNDITFPALNLALKSGYSDKLVAVISNNRELTLFGEKTTEYWYDSGLSGLTPFTRIDGKFSNVGCVSAGSVQKLSDQVFWVGQNEQGSLIVYSNEGGTAKRVSNYAVERILQKISADNYSKINCWTYQTGGHFFYAISAPGLDTTWTYDASTQLWAERQSTTKNNTQSRHLAYCVSYNAGDVFAGSYENGSIFVFDNNYFKDDDRYILRLRRSAHLSSSLNNLFVNCFQIDTQSGVGVDSSLFDESNPKYQLRVSRDGGKTWGLPRVAAAGEVGKWNERQRWNRCGMGRDFVFEVSITSAVNVNILSAWLVVEQAGS